MRKVYEKIRRVINNPKSTEDDIFSALYPDAKLLSEQEAIKLSILHWEKNKNGRLTHPYYWWWSQGDGSNSCALCIKFNCGNCPLSLAGFCCNNGDSPWCKAHNGNKRPLLKALRSLLAPKKSKGNVK